MNGPKETIEKLVSNCFKEIADHSLQSEVRSTHIKAINENLKSILSQLESLPSHSVDYRGRVRERANAMGAQRNDVITYAYVMSRFDFPIINDILQTNFNQTEAFEYLAQRLNVKTATLRNYRDKFDPYVEQEKSDRKGWHQVKLSPEFQSIKDEYDNKDSDEIKTILANSSYLSDSVLPATNSKGPICIQSTQHAGLVSKAPKIIYHPSDEHSFKQAFLQTKRAYILLHKMDGTKELKEWNAPKFNAYSNVNNNLRSGYLRGWRERGIIKAEITTNKSDLL